MRTGRCAWWSDGHVMEASSSGETPYSRDASTADEGVPRAPESGYCAAMGEEVAAQEFTRADRTRHREKVRRNLDVFARMLREARFDTDDPMTGLEVELNLVDEHSDPALKNAEALEAIADPDFQTELGQFNIEINVAPAKIREGGLATFEQGLRSSLNDAEASSAKVGAHMVMIGILPTLAEGHMTASSISANPRYALLGEQILAARGEDIAISISGHDRLETTSDSIVPEAACTSTQFHVQTSPDDFAALLERLAGHRRRPARARGELAVPARQAAVARDPDPAVRAGDRHPQRGAEGPGRAAAGLVRRAVDHLGVRPLRGERPLLPGAAADHRGGGPAPGPRGRRRAQAGRAPAAQRHDLPLEPPGVRRVAGVPHLRVENRILAAGPTVVDTIANAAFYFGLVRALATSERPLWSQMSFSAAEENFHVAAQQGIEAQLYWPGIGHVRATELVLRRLLPLAKQGLEDWGAPQDQIDRLLGRHRAALPGPDQRRRVVREPDGRSAGTRRRTTRSARRWGSTASGCTPTSRCTPGTDAGRAQPAGAGERSRSRFHATPAPVRGSTQPSRRDHDERQRDAGLAERRACGREPVARRRPASRARRAAPARPGGRSTAASVHAHAGGPRPRRPAARRRASSWRRTS